MPAKRCTFCAIIAREIPADIVGEDAAAVAFLDARPLFKGHVLVVPRVHHETLLDLPAAALGPFFAAVQRTARAVETGLASHGTFIAMNNRVSQSVPHLHAHVIPRHHKDGLRGFFWPRQPYVDDPDRESYAARIRAAW